MDGLWKEKREEILRLAAECGAHNVRIFGSFARGDVRPDSDVDFLVEFERGRGMMDIGGLMMDLEELLGRKVDVCTYDCFTGDGEQEMASRLVPMHGWC